MNIPSDAADDEIDADLQLAPTDPEADRGRQRMRENDFRPPQPVTPETPPLQYSIKQILVATAVFAFALAMTQALKPDMVAGLLGILAFATFIGVSILQPARSEPYMVAYGMIFLYVIVTCVALLR